MVNKYLKTLTPLTLDQSYAKKYGIKNFTETIFIVTLDDHYYYYMLANKKIDQNLNELKVVIYKNEAIDLAGNMKNFDCDYTVNFSRIFRIKKEELQSFIKSESNYRINWDKQLDIVVAVDKFINDSNKIKVIIVNDYSNEFSVVNQ